jgi:hypothetical protein
VNSAQPDDHRRCLWTANRAAPSPEREHKRADGAGFRFSRNQTAFPRAGRRGRAHRHPRSTRHHHRERGHAAHARQPQRDTRPDQLGAHLLSRVRSRRYAADRPSLRVAWTKAPARGFDHRIRRLLGAVRHVLESREHGAVPARSGHLRRTACAAEPSNPARCISPREARPGACGFRLRHHGRTNSRADARRLAHRHVQLARRLLHQRAHRAFCSPAFDGALALCADESPQDRLDGASPPRPCRRLRAIRS